MESIHFRSDDVTWETPDDLFAVLNQEFHFDLDVCAEASTAKCEHYFTPEIDGLSEQWQGVCWMNPPYERQISKRMSKAYESAQGGAATVVCLVPPRTDTEWWRD